MTDRRCVQCGRIATWSTPCRLGGQCVLEALGRDGSLPDDSGRPPGDPDTLARGAVVPVPAGPDEGVAS